jgi:3-hydroxyisobutyrate dehydrogenase-like beta-hydroxyacid dehydrogenase
MLKDLRIALSEAAERYQLPGTVLSAQLFEKLTKVSSELGNHALFKVYPETN